MGVRRLISLGFQDEDYPFSVGAGNRVGAPNSVQGKPPQSTDVATAALDFPSMGRIRPVKRSFAWTAETSP